MVAAGAGEAGAVDCDGAFVPGEVLGEGVAGTAEPEDSVAGPGASSPHAARPSRAAHTITAQRALRIMGPHGSGQATARDIVIDAGSGSRCAHPAGRRPVASQAVTAEPETPSDGLVDEPSPPWWGPVMLVAFVALVILSYIGTAVSTKWVNTDPEGLLMLSSRVRHLVGTAGGDIGFWPYFWIGGLRLALAFVVCHLIGRAYGRTVLMWFGRYLGVRAEQIKAMIDMFHRAEWFVIPFFAGSNVVAAISGITKVRPLRLGVLLTIGLVVRLVFWWQVARIADDQIDAVLDFLNTYQRPALIVSAVLTVAFVAFNVRRGRHFEL